MSVYLIIADVVLHQGGPLGEKVVRCKIGFTKASSKARMKALQTGSPFPIKLVNEWEGGPCFEKEIHKILKDKRVSGEWFELSKGLANFLSLATKDELIDYLSEMYWEPEHAFYEVGSHELGASIRQLQKMSEESFVELANRYRIPGLLGEL